MDTFTSQGGERLGRPSFSQPPNKQRLYVYSWQGKVDALTCQGEKLMDQPSFLHADNHLHKVDVLSCWGLGKNGPAQFFPTP